MANKTPADHVPTIERAAHAVSGLELGDGINRLLRARLFCACLPFLGLMVCLPAAGDEPKPPAPRQDYREFSRLIHKMVVKQLPKEFEDHSAWGQIVPLTEPVRFPNVPRARIRIGDKEGYPNGIWRRYKARIEDPARDLKVGVREFTKLDPKTFRLVVDSEVVLVGDGEMQNWVKGIALGRVEAQADARLDLGMVFNIGITLDTKKFPPDINVDPKLTDLRIDLADFKLRRIVNPTTNLAIEGEAAKSLGEDLKSGLKSVIKNFEPDVKKRANEAIAQSLKEGRGNFSAAALLRMAPAVK